MTKSTSFKPAIGNLFMMSYKSEDRSYQENVFRVLDCDNRITIAEMITGYSFKTTPYVFINKEITFYEISEERALLLGMKNQTSDTDQISDEEAVKRLSKVSLDVGYPSTTTISSKVTRKVIDMLMYKPKQTSIKSDIL